MTEQDRQEMLKKIGISSVNELYKDVADASLLKEPIAGLEDHQGEIEVDGRITSYAAKNRSAGEGPFFLGAGCYRHHIPSAVDHIIQRSEFLTSYTPYQPEISQGTLATIFQFQSIISLLTGMEVANASMYDAATALSEAFLMAMRVKRKRNTVAFANDVHPDYKKVAATFLDIAEAKEVALDQIDEQTAAIAVQYPDFYGNVPNLDDYRKKADEVGAMLIVVVNEIVSLGLLQAPSQADIVVGEASSLGVGLNFGGPLLGFFACKKVNVRQIPGRLCGASVDQDGKPGFVLTLNAREQHIRRDKATSNICSNQGLCATAFTIHASLLGEIGMKKLALINHKKACDFADKLAKIDGVKVLNDSFFNEFTIELTKDADEVNKKLLAKNIIGGLADGKKMILAVSELTSDADIEQFIKELQNIL